MADNTSAAWPIADAGLSQEILDLVQQASHYRQLKKGANEATKTLNRVSCIFLFFVRIRMFPTSMQVPSKMALGRACGVTRAVIAASITTNEASDLMGQIRTLKDKVERLMI
ncbi:RNA binding protein snu13 [Coniosporium apollinis]|uniref:H/ACA ribonucleoprotein complex subunit 2 n=1 Tax=Coniosporium apollinis TaxID=61459 RepID=A0ABQ9NLN8_9PEZI|nr:RNA binding protein snu13 [Coniosporium apollinis]